MTEAEEAAGFWGASLTQTLRNRENAVHAIRLPDGRPAALRLHRQGYQSEAAIRSELWWCGALAEAGLPVPAPIPTRDGVPLARLASGRLASSLTWIEGHALGEAGHPLPGSPSERHARHHALGALLAQIHNATDRLTLPDDFNRPAWDIAGLVGETPFWGRFWDHPLLTPAEQDLLIAARAHLRDRLVAHAKDHPLGPIHADVLRENVMVRPDGGLALIDFDDSGIGFRHYDLGTVLSQDLYEPDRPALQAALIAGYGAHRPIDPAMVPVFTLARVLASVGWVMTRLPLDHPVHKSHIARATMWARHVLSDGR
ncbi:phosphotransferase enzyme family protein [Gemmobacter serpentinus]|uniref:phosphotransferase enzyme family protein n=1 Tax=Gemmobacter serpentinus TaxID=2652247 RepID=UPI00124F49CC|nr:phosphotransferase [Gemmobacter serpentinus]